VNDNCTNCTSSGANLAYYYPAVTNYPTCIISCPVLGWYTNTTNLTCMKCPTGCIDCKSDVYCWTCDTAAGYAYWNNMCYNPCYPNTYKLNTTNCSACNDPYCGTCDTDINYCDSCMTFGPTTSYLIGVICYPICPSPNYGATNPNVCKPCNSACMRCNGPNNGNCL